MDAGTHTISAPLQLNTAVSKFGVGSLRLTGTISGAGKGLTIGSGTVILESPSADLSGLGAIANGGSLVINNAAAQNIDVPISGTGGLDKNGAGLLTVGGSLTYTGATNINNGTVKLNPTVALTLDSAVEKHGPRPELDRALLHGASIRQPCDVSLLATGVGSIQLRASGGRRRVRRCGRRAARAAGRSDRRRWRT